MRWGWAKALGVAVGVGALQTVNTSLSTGSPMIPFPWNIVVAAGLGVAGGYVTHQASNTNPDGTPASQPYVEKGSKP